MRIAHVFPCGVHAYSGIPAAVGRLVTELHRRGTDVETWELHEAHDPALARRLDAVLDPGIDRVRLPVRHTWWLGRRATRSIEGHAADLVHLHGAFSPANNLLARSLDVPYVVSPHGGFAPPVFDRGPWRKALFGRLVESPTLDRAAAAFALNEAEADDLRAFGYRGTIEIVPHGIDVHEGACDGSPFRREIGLADDDRLAVYVGRMDIYYKRIDDLIHGLATAPAWKLALVGPQWRDSRRRLERLVSRLGLEGRVFMVGPREGERLRTTQAAGDLFALLSRSEGMPLALFEALEQGRAALVSPEVEERLGIARAGAGWVAAPDEIGPRLAALATLPRVEWRRHEEAARTLARSFSWPDTAARYERIYRRLTGRAPRRNPAATRPSPARPGPRASPPFTPACRHSATRDTGS